MEAKRQPAEYPEPYIVNLSVLHEDKIQKSIMALSKGKTLLVIAHRLSTIQNADQIVVLKKGRIVDCGKQEELLKRCPLYADMWKAHIGAKNWSVSEKKEVAAHV